MLDAITIQRITNLREMAQMVVDEADEVLRLNEPDSSLPGSSSKGGLTEEQKAHMLVKKRRAAARAKYLQPKDIPHM